MATLPAMIHCERCAFWHQLGEHHGICERSAPQPSDRPERIAHWPETSAKEGCGDGASLETQATARVRCGACLYWHTSAAGGLNPLDRGVEGSAWWKEAGLCRRHAPRPLRLAGNRAFWKATHRTDGCGEGAA